MKDFFSLYEGLRKDIATNSGKFPEGSTVKCKKSGKTGKVLTVGKDFVKVAVGNKQIDYKPSELELVKESVELDEARVTPGDLKAQAEGKKAAKAGKKYEDNPYEKGTSRHLQWAKGHNSWREKNESSDLDEAKTFNSLEGWVIAVVDAGGTIMKRGNNLSASGLKRTQSATWELKKGRGSMIESAELDENKKPHPQGSAKFYRGAMDKYKANTPKKSNWDMYMDYKKAKKEDIDLEEKRKYKVTKNGKERMVNKQELGTYKQMGWKEVKEAVDENFKVSYKDAGTYSVVFRNKNGKVESEISAPSKEKAEKQAAIRNKKVKPSEGAWEVIKTGSVDEAVEDDMPASPDEASMAMDQAKFIQYVGKEIEDYISGGKEFPEWMQNKLSALHEKAKGMHAVMAGKYEGKE